jgi:oligopeptide/dipeptide ABC transporter ATP-binding protein
MASARVLAVRGPRLISRYVLPNIAETLFIGLSVTISNSVVAVSSLSFLGLGVQPPEYDWGQLLTAGVQTFYLNPAAAVGPAIAISISAMAFGFTGEALARATNPRLWTSDARRRRARSRTRTGDSRADAAAHAPVQANALALPEQALRVSDLRVAFPGADGPIEVVRGLSFAVARGEMVGIVGESGSGKTMTALAMAQLVPYPAVASGTIELSGVNLNTLSGRQLDRLLGTELAFVFQDPLASLNPAVRIGTQLTEVVQFHGSVSRADATRMAIARLREVGIPAAETQLQRHPHEFSGGMRQRTMIAMGLMNEPSVLIADEPTTALDVTIQAQIMELLRSINANDGTAIILISHNLALVRQNCSRILVMYAGEIVEDIPAARLLDSAAHPYTQDLVSVVPAFGKAPDEPLAVIPGQPPDPAALPSGCPYHPRCRMAQDRCREERPALLEVSSGHMAACWFAPRVDREHAASAPVGSSA